MASKRRLNYAELAYEDVVCPICLSILIEPVTMPCWHSLCRSCFTLHVQETSLECPLCRMRISVWVRRNSKTNSIVNNRLWTAIKENFPAKVEARLQGREDSDEEEYAGFEPKVCAPGEIKQEYEALVQQEIREQASRKSQEEELSNQLIQQLQEEERCKLRHHKQTEERLCKEDEILAKKIKEAEDTVLQEKLRHLRMVCGNDEEVARQIEREERMKTNALSKPSKLSHTPAKGPMDVFIGQKTPSPQGKLPVQDYSHQSSSKSGDFSSNLSYLSDSIASSSKTSGYGGSPVSTGVIKTHCGTVGSNIGRQLKEITSLQSSESDSDEMITFTDVSKVRQTNPTGKENISQVERKKAQNSKNKPKIRTPFKGKDKSEIESPKKTLQEPFVTRTRAISLDLDVDMNTDNAESIIFAENGNDTYTDNDPDYEISGCCNRVKSYCCNQKETHLKKNNVREKSVVEASEPVEGVCTLEESNEGEQNSSMDYGLFFEDLGLQNMEKFKEEQIKLEEQIEQEKADRLLAEMIQKQFYQEVGRIDRSRGSEDEYALRNRRPAATSASKASPVSRKSGKRERQTTIDESMAKRCKNR